jgi:antitoxin component of MazEF toxin-antitoxin module
MSTIFEAKVRQLGNSMAVIIPKDVLDETGAKEGDTLKLSLVIPKQRRKESLRKMAGITADSKPFVRERQDRI